MWKMDEKTLEYRGIKILNERRLFFIPNMSRELKCGKRWGREKRHGLVRQD
jgi:hypothetical protein